MSTIKISDLRKEYNSPGGGTIVAVDGVDLEIGQEDFLTLVGPSGCGKTTTLRSIAGLETPTSGTIELNGDDITEVKANERELAMMFQDIALYPHMTVKNNIAYPLKVRNVPKSTRYEKAAEAAEVMQISDLLDKYPGELSGGQRQRAALARTLVQDPVAFLMDEPLSDLDAKLQVEIRKEIQKIHQKIEKPTIYVTHNQEEALTMSDRIAVMNKGNIEQVGTPAEVYHEPANMFVAEFIGMPSMNFLDGALEELSADHARVSTHGFEFEWDVGKIYDKPSSDEVTLGFRPEAVSVVEDSVVADFEQEVKLLERIGDRMLAYVEGFEGEIRVTTKSHTRVTVGESIPLQINRNGMYLFDSDTGVLVAKGTSAKPSEVSEMSA